MKKTFVTLMATAALAAVVAPIATVSANSYKEPVETSKTANVEQYSLEVSTLNVKYGQAWKADQEQGSDLLAKETTLSAAKLDLDTANKALAVAESELASVKTQYNDFLGLTGQGVVPAEFAHIGSTVAAVDAYFKADIQKFEAKVKSAKLDVEAKTTVLTQAQAAFDASLAKKVETKKAADAAKAALDAAIAAANARNVKAPIATVEVTRLYNPRLGYHFFTTSASRAAALNANGWNVEGTAFKAPKDGAAVYAIVSPKGYTHFSANAEEIKGLEAIGWKKTEAVFNSGSEGVSVSRLYNPNTGLHFFSSNAEEIAGLVAKGWNNEGHAFFVAE